MALRRVLIAIAISISGVTTPHAQHPQMPRGMTHEEHLKQMPKEAELKRRGTEAMGFDQNKATHHFRLTPSGGSIEILVSSSSDTTTRDQIRSHLKEVADEFSQGLFDKPFATHGEMPPGTAEMKSLAKEIRYVFDETPTGAVVRIETSNAAAREAIHAFLRYQIKEHATGDSPTGKR